MSVSSLVRGSLPAPFELGPIMVDRIIIYIDNITGQFGSSLADQTLTLSGESLVRYSATDCFG